MSKDQPLQQPSNERGSPLEVKPDSQVIAKALLDIESGKQLTKHQHDVLEGLIETVAQKDPGMVAQIAIRQEMYAGPLPQARELNSYDEATRNSIVQMAVDDQKHVHAMQTRGLSGAIAKDRVAQICACVIALGGFAAAAYIAQFSGAAAAVIGSLDMLGIVCAFIAPRALEAMVAKKQPAQAQPQKRKAPPKKR